MDRFLFGPPEPWNRGLFANINGATIFFTILATIMMLADTGENWLSLSAVGYIVLFTDKWRFEMLIV